MEPRYTNPALLWALSQGYAAKRWTDRLPGPSDLHLTYYPATGSGYWIQHGKKIYWQADMADSFFTTCDQGALAKHEIGEVVLMHRGTLQSVVLGHNLSEAVGELLKQNKGVL